MLKLVMLRKHASFIFCLFVFLALLARNPFSDRTLIPNLEPYPDTIHYLGPVTSFVDGNGFGLFREGRILKSWVPPLYSAIMIPAFLIRNDVRMFYFVNVILALTSFTFFYLIVRKFTDNLLVIGPTLLFYSTNYFNYWYPSLAMGENLIIPLFLAALWLLTRKHSIINMIFVNLLGIAIYATKTANMPIAASLFIGYAIKLFWDNKEYKRFRHLAEHLAVFSIVFLLFSVYYQMQYGSSIISSMVFFVSNILGFRPQQAGSTQFTGDSWFSLKYMSINLPVYLKAMIGGYPVKFLWDNTPIIPAYVGIPGIAGLVISLFNRKTRLFGITLLFILTVSILFMSTFYATDMRYLYHSIPILLFGFALFFSRFKLGGKFVLVLPAVIILISGSYMVTNAVRLKNQVMLNFRYAESPWYFISVEKLNKYFTKPTKPKPFVITAMIPYYVDFYSNGNYQLLPMSDYQDFYAHKEQAWGALNYTDLEAVYARLIRQGREVYVLNYLGNEPNISKDYESIKTNFNAEKVSEGCYGSCDIYRLSL